jgi:hypothetical protein
VTGFDEHGGGRDEGREGMQTGRYHGFAGF